VSGFDRLPDAAAELFGAGATAEEKYGLLTVDVPAASWIAALTIARDTLGCTFFDWLSAVDEPGTGFRICVHVVALGGGAGASPVGAGVDTGAGEGASPGTAGPGSSGPVAVRKLLIRTAVPYEAAELPTATGVFAGAAWHERETHEMFGVGFTGHPHLAPLLLPDEFEGHPLRKDFVLAARVAKAWPGAKEPGESHDGGPKRRQMQPPGVPDPNEWGPLKGQLPPATARPARTPRAAGAAGTAGAAGERPARRARTAAEGSAGQTGAETAPAPRRTRTAGEGSASRPPAPGADPGTAPPAPPRKRVADAPWEQPRETPEANQSPTPAQAPPAPSAGAGDEPPTEPGPVAPAGDEPPTEPVPPAEGDQAPDPEPVPPAEGGEDPTATPTPPAGAGDEPSGEGEPPRAGQPRPRAEGGDAS
jgi:hypothetical protein